MGKKLGEHLPSNLQQQASTLMEKIGVDRASSKLGVSRHTLERAAGGLTIQHATAELLSRQLAAREEKGEK